MHINTAENGQENAHGTMYRCIGRVHGFHSRTSAFAHSASITVLGCLKKGEEKG